MKKVLSLLLCIMLLICGLSACGSDPSDPVATPEGLTYDESVFAFSTSVDGVGFLCPLETTQSISEYSTMDAYSAKDAENMYFQYVNGGTYAILRPARFALYTFDIGKRIHVEGKTDVNVIANYLSIDDLLDFSPAEGGSNYRTEADQEGNIKNTFDVIFTDELLGETFYGNLSILKRGSDSSVFIMAVGFTQNSTEAKTASQIMIDSFCLTDSE